MDASVLWDYIDQSKLKDGLKCLTRATKKYNNGEEKKASSNWHGRGVDLIKKWNEYYELSRPASIWSPFGINIYFWSHWAEYWKMLTYCLLHFTMILTVALCRCPKVAHIITSKEVQII